MNELKDVLHAFSVDGEFSASEINKGHINSTFLIEAGEAKYILQKINTAVFKNPYAVMENIEKVTAHLKKKGVDTLDFLKTNDGKIYFENQSGFFRCYAFLQGKDLEAPTKENMKKCGVAFGAFQKALSDFDASELTEVIPNFHNTKQRYLNLQKALNEDKFGRKKDCEKLLADIEVMKHMAFHIGKKTLPLRVTHNDTKTNNVLELANGNFAVIDLDTVMPGLSAYDFGDAIRFGANTAQENEEDLSKVNFSLPVFESFARGYLSQIGKIYKNEKNSLTYGAITMTFECGIRFLTDYLEGDVYFRISKPDENLIRARNQLHLCHCMIDQFESMMRVVDSI